MNKYQEALDEIKEEFGCDTAYYGLNIHFELLQEAIDKANKYDEKETPKKVDIKISKKPGWDPRNFHCSNCSRKLKRDRSYQYCPRCGTKINWSDE